MTNVLHEIEKKVYLSSGVPRFYFERLSTDPSRVAVPALNDDTSCYYRVWVVKEDYTKQCLNGIVIRYPKGSSTVEVISVTTIGMRVDKLTCDEFMSLYLSIFKGYTDTNANLFFDHHNKTYDDFLVPLANELVSTT